MSFSLFRHSNARRLGNAGSVIRQVSLYIGHSWEDTLFSDYTYLENKLEKIS